MGTNDSIAYNDQLSLLLQGQVFDTIVYYTLFVLVFAIGMIIMSYLDTYRFSSYRSYNKRFLQQTKDHFASGIEEWKLYRLQKWQPSFGFYTRVFLLVMVIASDVILIITKTQGIVTGDMGNDLLSKDYYKGVFPLILCLAGIALLYWVIVTIISLLSRLHRKVFYAKGPNARIRRVKIKQ